MKYPSAKHVLSYGRANLVNLSPFYSLLPGKTPGEFASNYAYSPFKGIRIKF